MKPYFPWVGNKCDNGESLVRQIRRTEYDILIFRLSIDVGRAARCHGSLLSRRRSCWACRGALRRKVTRALLTNRYATSTLKVPTLDGCASMMEDARISIAKRGMKPTICDDFIIQFILYFWQAGVYHW
ncbi:hypothetical protein TraAM80_00856 [Trypanosoma rangeli]|uniref:Uncharacterized protein n=1 Tax=Trypanosoma rangeli TaxID=5698 RepID=A0A3R7KX91_TRYRA|nr:uncharacterized protein TraAM80_00856 [Trypanosoma rangeli]RNF11528.1 hypothetical protein TraAM80_00856 [Trypanosoma rangeli]|eukprot:RNF11528.1 hypothetical protein TraAM80_00856 [Trypanosoma rangeli]